MKELFNFEFTILMILVGLAENQLIFKKIETNFSSIIWKLLT